MIWCGPYFIWQPQLRLRRFCLARVAGREPGSDWGSRRRLLAAGQGGPCVGALRHLLVPGSLLILGLLLATPLLARHPSPLVPLEGDRYDALLVAIDADWNFQFSTAEGRQIVSRESLVRWGRCGENDSRMSVLLADGSRLVAESASIGETAIEVANPVCGTVCIARQRVRGIVFSPPSARPEHDLLKRQIQQATGLADRVLLINGDQLTGRVLPSPTEAAAHSSTAIGVVRRERERPVWLESTRVEAVIFNPALSEPAPADPPAAWLGLRDGTLLAVDRIEPHAPAGLTLRGGQRLEIQFDRFWPAVCFIQPRSSRLIYLSDLEPLSYLHLPFLQLSWTWRQDQNVLGRPLRTGGAVVLKGLGMHSASRLTYELRGRFRRFDAELALDDQAGIQGSVVYQVFVQTVEQAAADRWTLAYKSPVVRGAQPPLPISVEVSAAERLALIVEFADRGDQLDYANWLDARLIPARNQ